MVACFSHVCLLLYPCQMQLFLTLHIFMSTNLAISAQKAKTTTEPFFKEPCI